MSMMTNNDPIDEFLVRVNRLFGVYMDSIWGFNLVHRQAKEAESRRLAATPQSNFFMSYVPEERVPDSPTTMSDEEMQRRNIARGTSTQIMERTSLEGSDTAVLGQMLISSIFNLWKDEYRPKIASYNGVNNSVVSIPAFEDLCHLRDSIVHHDGEAKKEVKNATVFPWFAKGQTIVFTNDQIRTIKNHLNDNLRNECTACLNSTK